MAAQISVVIMRVKLLYNLGSHILNLANKQLKLGYNKNNWGLTFVGDNTATAKGQNDIRYGIDTPIRFNNKTNVTFQNVNIDGNGQFGQTGGNSADLKLSGNNNINITHEGGTAALLVESAEVTDGTTVISHSDSKKMFSTMQQSLLILRTMVEI